MGSLRVRLLGLWALSLIASVAVGLLLVQLYRQSTAAQVGRAEAVVGQACSLIRGHYDFYVAGWSGPAPPPTDARLRSDLGAVVTLALARQQGVEGGIWQAAAGSLVYAFPTYAGSGPKTDLPAAERAQIAAVNRQARHNDAAVDRRAASQGETLLLHACLLPGPIAGLSAWTMARVTAAPGAAPLRLGVGVLLALMLLMSAWLGRTLFVWARHVRGIETGLAAAGAGDGSPVLARTGERELDRVVDALNEAVGRLGEARREAESLAARVARAERLAGLGRVAAGVAHEIRNPIAAARLQGENALAGDDARRRAAIGDMLAQVNRLDALVDELLAMTQRAAPQPIRLDLDPFLAALVAPHRALAAQRGIAIRVAASVATAVLDPAVVGRVLDNLLTNAIRHAPEGGSVAVSAAASAGLLTLTVEDDGPGVPAELTERLFEPFVTGRADGTGLGLAIARELADAHGGRLVLRRAGGKGAGEGGAAFALELPQES